MPTPCRMPKARIVSISHPPASALRNGFGRVVLVYIVAGIVANILAYLADATVLAAQGPAAMKTQGMTELSANQIAAFNLD